MKATKARTVEAFGLQPVELIEAADWETMKTEEPALADAKATPTQKKEAWARTVTKHGLTQKPSKGV